jgi:hypothetical protein
MTDERTTPPENPNSTFLSFKGYQNEEMELNTGMVVSNMPHCESPYQILLENNQ